MPNRDTIQNQPANGQVVYPDGSVLLRPQEPTGPRLVLAIVIIAAAVIIGFFMIKGIADNVIYAADGMKTQIQKILSTGTTYDEPVLANYVGLSDEECLQSLNNAGYSLTAIPKVGEEGSSLDVVKTVSGVPETDIVTFYNKSGSGFKGDTAVTILHNSWRFSVNHNDSTVLRVRYADFTSGSVAAAINNAMALQGFTAEMLTGSGTDEAGNTFKEGLIETSDGTYSWRISSIALSEIYSSSNLPESAFYVGVRMQHA